MCIEYSPGFTVIDSNRATNVIKSPEKCTAYVVCPETFTLVNCIRSCD